MYRVSTFLRDFALALLIGAVTATLWVNISPGHYYDAMEWRLIDPDLPRWIGASDYGLTLIRLVAEVLMSLFFFFLGKEFWEALMLERGALHGRRAVLPVFATVGGMVAAVLGWLVLSAMIETAEEAYPGAGWVVPLGGDALLAYLFGRIVFGAAHPALHVLLLVTIAMDITGLLTQGLAFPEARLTLAWLILPVLAAFGAWWFAGRSANIGASERLRRRSLHLWPYVLAGIVSWIGVFAAGLPPALGLLPIIPVMPHADHAFGLFAEAEEYLTDPLNRLAHHLVIPLYAVLFLFGLTHGAVDLAALAPTTLVTLGAFWVAKPLGMVLGGLILARALGFRLPPGMGRRDFLIVALLCGIGFTVPALSLASALPGGAMQEAARLGLALSIAAGPLAVLIAPVIRRRKPPVRH
ncbi:sodium:proton antiporter [Aliigemmobacter aestuarii]|uniref:Putative Na(+)/H(+) antiporter NhaA homolog n=1 Tax=Aliigemmobacter aestuarii TaxID=1445661 RepID=A0A4S3MLX9_9RHOB|nr:Na+/H+ antiporter NhaA [Gemmobacter aestuarii]THD83035.1 sodium:proton antiporter [Gemmobacter aestuarii]